ncbi:LodA/GoxA family CTQ-dependent oxidase [Deinococcus cellulosilyticus]|uniref:L-lysine 6-oxidase n=1 Tax=Deinococcus cellulosilyticus (strain DSM 18568 / NBRC 106333 / KACC 11606 / 5516J-15) TaxID=1223518 RepID=A0A511MVG6_DEIC1|nr:LodA/GoxA family CTQ-dependent oxidase [Deinococcus cellulosilyticus]GEM44574.1 hypothetical protein DC3_02090 [Deinococcus cellulosilyticus NBRC 106333 = KACC 11606]
MTQSEIHSVAIYPGIGIARVGNSDEYFIAPEIPGALPDAGGSFKGQDKKVKRQAARFRIYGLDENGVPVREITAEEATITWRVELANLKPGWYQFINAMDLGGLSKSAPKRNSGFQGEDRKQIILTPGSKSISGVNQSGTDHEFHGSYLTQDVYMGELRTDDQGRLLVLGGHGDAYSAVPGARPITFANNDGWCDDVSDGPVRATVQIGDQTFEAEPGYVVVTPPNFAPGLHGPLTMLDVVHNLYQDMGWYVAPAEPSFQRDVLPIFQRLTANQWVNNGVFMAFGYGSPLNFEDANLIQRLADPGEENQAFRQRIFELFRPPTADHRMEDYAPPFYGDGFGEATAEDFLNDLPLTPLMYATLQKWASGAFVSDLSQQEQTDFSGLEPAAQCEALNQAGLYDCLGGPFHPGIEMTWVMRRANMWKAPYRLNLLPEGELPSLDYGEVLYPAVCLNPEQGPLSANGPGSLTRWMGVPWHTDEASCASGYDPHFYVSTPSFWAARVPNQILSDAALPALNQSDLPERQAMKRFAYRQDWYRDIQGSSYYDRINNMIHEWWELGIIEPTEVQREGYPSRMWLETGRNEALTGTPDYSLKLIEKAEAFSQPHKLRMKLLSAKPAEGRKLPRRVYNQWNR